MLLCLTMPATGQATEQTAGREMSAMASYCIETLTQNKPLIASSMVGATAEAIGRPDADERAEFSRVPHEQLVISSIRAFDLSACGAFLEEGAGGWSMASVDARMEELGLIHAEACSIPSTKLWFLPKLAPQQRGVTAAAQIEGGIVVEVMAFETVEVAQPQKCVEGAAQ